MPQSTQNIVSLEAENGIQVVEPVLFPKRQTSILFIHDARQSIAKFVILFVLHLTGNYFAVRCASVVKEPKAYVPCVAKTDPKCIVPKMM